MNYDKLERNITDAIIEQQIKLGYVKETVGLYYPAQSLKNILQCQSVSFEELSKILGDFAMSVASRLGDIGIERKGERFCIKVPPAGSEYIHEHQKDNEFLVRLIAKLMEHDCDIQGILDVFHEFSSNVVCEKMKNADFDYVVYFENYESDEYRYCFKQEGCHMIYHRFTKDDYMEF